MKAVEVKGALELGKRLAAHKAPGRTKIRDAADVAAQLMVQFKEYETERFVVLLLNTKNEVMKTIEVSRGGLAGTHAAPADVFRQAVREGAGAVIVAHNHPSGDPEPSSTDLELTLHLKEAGNILGIRVLDHVIFGDGRYISLKARQVL